MLSLEEALIVAYARVLVLRTKSRWETGAKVRAWVDESKTSGRHYHDVVTKAYAICWQLGTRSLFSPQVFGWPKEVTG